MLNKENTEAVNKLFEFNTNKMLHCTAKFYGKNIKKPTTVSLHQQEEYYKNSNVSESNGRAFRLKISGFTLTKQTYCK